jgi:hypothetical protein
MKNFVLMSKYHEARNWCDRMTRRFPKHRPNCDEILAHKHLWALNDGEFDASKELKNISNLNRMKDTIVYTFIIEGLIWFNKLMFTVCSIS